MLSRLRKPLSTLLTHPVGRVAIVTAFLVTPLLAVRVKPHAYEPRIAFSAEAQTDASTSAVARLFGELRTSLSDILFIKTERYLHSGVAYANHSGVSEEMGKHEGHHDHDHGGAGTVIRPPDEDWRGFIGTLQREVHPWQDPRRHMQHTPGTQLLPWYRMMTIANPHRIRGYRIGAMWLIAEGDPAALEVARDFIAEGLRHNPTSHELHYTMARIQLRQDDMNAALAALRQAVEYGAAQRPEDGWELEGTDREKENALGAAIRMEVFVLHRLGRNHEALRRAQEGLRIYGDDPVLRQTLGELRDLLAS